LSKIPENPPNQKMVHQLFDTSSIYYHDVVQYGSGRDDHFRGGSVFQRGYGGGGVQTGAGVGDVFKGLWRFFRPLLQRVGTAVGEEALNTGQRVLGQIREGKPIKETLIAEGKKGLDTVLEQGGMAKQFGTGRKRRRAAIKRGRTVQSVSQTIIPSTVTNPIARSKKRLKADIFGLY